MPMVATARDAAQAKVAAIGSVNPRAGGLLNRVAQAFKKLVARALQWFVRDQVVFNRVDDLRDGEAAIEALAEQNRSLLTLTSQANERFAALYSQDSRKRAKWRRRKRGIWVPRCMGCAMSYGNRKTFAITGSNGARRGNKSSRLTKSSSCALLPICRALSSIALRSSKITSAKWCTPSTAIIWARSIARTWTSRSASDRTWRACGSHTKG